MSRPYVVLVGPPGAGKTTVGRLLADRLRISFRDTDDEVEKAAGKSVADIFIEDGEPAFRELESAAAATALAGHDGVLALGGGAVEVASTRELLHGHQVIFLDVHLTEAAKRIGLTQSRPLLLGNPRATLAQLLDQRRARYSEVATATVATDGRTAEEVAVEVAALGYDA